MNQSAILVSNEKCNIVMVNFIEITKLEWISWYINVSDAIELFVVLKTGTSLNTLATQITNRDIYGDIYFVKLYQGKCVTIEYSDIPGLMDILITKLTMTDNSFESNPTDYESNPTDYESNPTDYESNPTDYEYYDPNSMWDDGWDDDWRIPTNGYDSW
jgi:hypothetical protein